MPTAEEYKSRYEKFLRYISNAANGKGVIDPENAKSIKFAQDLLRKLDKYEPKVSSTGNKEEDERSYWSKKYLEASVVWDEILDRSQEDKRKRETEEKKAYYEREYQSYKEEKQSERNWILACLKLRNVSEQQRTAKSAKQIAFATTTLILTLTGVLYDKYSKSTRVLGEATTKHLSEEHEKRYVQSYLNQLELPPEAANWNEADLQEWFGRNILNAKTKYSKEKLNNLLKNAGRMNFLKEEQKMGKRVLMQTKKRGVGKFAKALFKPEKYIEEDFKSHFEKF